jgi:hypothetical protein
MPTKAIPTLGPAWQDLPLRPSADDLYAVLLLQLGSPSFSVPVAHPSKEGAKAYAQVLLVPSTAIAGEVIAALRRLLAEGSVLFVRGLENGTISDHAMSCPHNLTAILVLRSNDPACPAACHPKL